MQKSIYYIAFLFLLGCSEPFSFESSDTVIDVVDAKVSTIVGESYVRIYSIKDGADQAIEDLDVKVIAESGVVHGFRYYPNFQRYQPEISDFKGLVGSAYKMEVTRPDGSNLIAYDTIPEKINVNTFFSDTTIFEYSPDNVIVKKHAIATIAEIEPKEDLLAKIDFQYSYRVSDGRTVLIYEPDKYILHQNQYEEEANEWRPIPVGILIPCCFAIANTKVSLESMSNQAFEFWSDAKQLLNNKGLVLDTYPFPLWGNIECENCENEVVGFFRSVAETQIEKTWGDR